MEHVSGVKRKIILRQIFKEEHVKLWDAFMRFRIGNIGDIFAHTKGRR